MPFDESLSLSTGEGSVLQDSLQTGAAITGQSSISPSPSRSP